MPVHLVKMAVGAATVEEIEAIQVRQLIHGVAAVVDEDGVARCELRLAPSLVRTEARPMRAFQGWRYLEPAAAPLDLMTTSPSDGPPPEMARELRRLGLL